MLAMASSSRNERDMERERRDALKRTQAVDNASAGPVFGQPYRTNHTDEISKRVRLLMGELSPISDTLFPSMPRSSHNQAHSSQLSSESQQKPDDRNSHHKDRKQKSSRRESSEERKNKSKEHKSHHRPPSKDQPSERQSERPRERSRTPSASSDQDSHTAHIHPDKHKAGFSGGPSDKGSGSLKKHPPTSETLTGVPSSSQKNPAKSVQDMPDVGVGLSLTSAFKSTPTHSTTSTNSLASTNPPPVSSNSSAQGFAKPKPPAVNGRVGRKPFNLVLPTKDDQDVTKILDEMKHPVGSPLDAITTPRKDFNLPMFNLPMPSNQDNDYSKQNNSNGPLLPILDITHGAQSNATTATNGNVDHLQHDLSLSESDSSSSGSSDSSSNSESDSDSSDDNSEVCPLIPIGLPSKKSTPPAADSEDCSPRSWGLDNFIKLPTSPSAHIPSSDPHRAVPTLPTNPPVLPAANQTNNFQLPLGHLPTKQKPRGRPPKNSKGAIEKDPDYKPPIEGIAVVRDDLAARRAKRKARMKAKESNDDLSDQSSDQGSAMASEEEDIDVDVVSSESPTLPRVKPEPSSSPFQPVKPQVLAKVEPQPKREPKSTLDLPAPRIGGPHQAVSESSNAPEFTLVVSIPLDRILKKPREEPKPSMLNGHKAAPSQKENKSSPVKRKIITELIKQKEGKSKRCKTEEDKSDRKMLSPHDTSSNQEIPVPASVPNVNRAPNRESAIQPAQCSLGDFQSYQDRAKELKRLGHGMTERPRRYLTNLEALVYFMMSNQARESAEPGKVNDIKKYYEQMSDFADHIIKDGREDDVPKDKVDIFKCWLCLSNYLLSQLSFKIWRMAKDGAMKSSRIIDEHMKDRGEVSPHQLPMPCLSPAPSPASINSTGSMASDPGRSSMPPTPPSVVAVPVNVYKSVKQFHTNTKWLMKAHDVWTTASYQQMECKDFFSKISNELGYILTMHTESQKFLHYVETGLNRLKGLL